MQIVKLIFVDQWDILVKNRDIPLESKVSLTNFNCSTEERGRVEKFYGLNLLLLLPPFIFFPNCRDDLTDLKSCLTSPGIQSAVVDQAPSHSLDGGKVTSL